MYTSNETTLFKAFLSDVTVEDLHPEKDNHTYIKQESEMSDIKQEAEPETPYIKEEEQENEIGTFPLIVIVKSEEDEGPGEEIEAAKPMSDSSFQHLTIKA
ncbi:uncharacterized protein LOC130917766 isoform X3 [Corythoichthys intestinalis]|uniref:uncharacterized protein LOC130917766 isoform X3 n=1 Tax=Corythoichthys intestinalis TaxID=161448 RepID=UPI0025A52B1F|nr:uncharacterized protein LOC130917766 isoform X3 [Corythoichthys intestinalis]